MKVFFTVLFSCVILTGLQAQVVQVSPTEGANSPYDPFNSLSMQTVYGLDLNTDYLFLVKDDVQQIMFNPARATTFEGGFVQGAFNGSNTDNFSTAVLVPAKTGKWFFTAGGTVESEKRDKAFEGFQQYFDVRTNGNSSLEMLEEDYFTENIDSEVERNQVELRLLKVLDSGKEEGKAFGVFGGYAKRQNSLLRNQFEENFQLNEEFRMDTLFRRTENESEMNSRSYDVHANNKFIVGIEFYSWQQGSDLIQRLYVERNDYDLMNQGYSYNEQVSESIDQYGQVARYSDGSFRRTDRKSASNPWQFRYQLYKNMPLNTLGSDYLFGNLQFVYGFGNQTVQREFTDEDNNLNITFDDPRTTFIGGRFAAGYAITHQAENLTLVSGLTPFYELQFEAINRIVGSEKRMVDIVQQQVGGQLPVFASFSVSSNVQVWGGGTVQVDYRSKKNDFKQIPNQSAPEREVPVTESSSEDRSTNLQQKVYAGLSYKHDSGFGIQANTRGSLANLNRWFISISYRF